MVVHNLDHGCHLSFQQSIHYEPPHRTCLPSFLAVDTEFVIFTFASLMKNIPGDVQFSGSEILNYFF